jgi:hypothetical protein
MALTNAGSATRAHLKRLVCEYLEDMRSLGRAPNRTVAFESVHLSAWLVDDPVPHSRTRRYLLLDDGDAWCETVYGPQPVASGLRNTYSWLSEPTTSLAFALHESLDDARAGGDGFLIAPADRGSAYVVSDRRSRPRG